MTGPHPGCPAHAAAATPANAAAVVVDDLRRSFGTTEALSGVSFSVGRGELFGVVGPDGAGKTTLLRILAGVLAPTAGDARVSGRSTRDDPEGVKHHIAYMAQRFGLYVDLTVRENIDFYADLYRVPRRLRPARLERLYQFSQLGPFERRLAGNLSGGMKQKLSLCCALIHEPEVLLLDEPTFGVDPISRRDLWLIIHEMVASGVTTIASTAYLDEAERCDRVVLLHEGRVLGVDPPADFLTGLAHRVMSLEVAAARKALGALREDPAIESADMFGDVVHATMKSSVADWPAVAERLAGHGVEIMHAAPAEPSLEDSFLELTRGG